MLLEELTHLPTFDVGEHLDEQSLAALDIPRKVVGSLCYRESCQDTQRLEREM